jgi:hypothetical protein
VRRGAGEVEVTSGLMLYFGPLGEGAGAGFDVVGLWEGGCWRGRAVVRRRGRCILMGMGGLDGDCVEDVRR